MAHPPRLIEAFGEKKTFKEWFADPRCRTKTQGMLETRIRKGIPPEQAITQEPEYEMITAFGETKTSGDWGRDKRSAVSGQAILRRISKGMTPEDAITLTKINGKVRPKLIPAFGEIRPFHGWLRDARCIVKEDVLSERVYKCGWTMERAMTTPAAIQEEPANKELLEMRRTLNLQIHEMALLIGMRGRHYFDLENLDRPMHSSTRICLDVLQVLIQQANERNDLHELISSLKRSGFAETVRVRMSTQQPRTPSANGCITGRTHIIRYSHEG